MYSGERTALVQLSPFDRMVHREVELAMGMSSKFNMEINLTMTGIEGDAGAIGRTSTKINMQIVWAGPEELIR